MGWGFLGEFWNAITEKTLDAWVYTVDWFQQIGLATAGALGNLLDYLIHSLSDFFVFLGWLFSAIKELVLAITQNPKGNPIANQMKGEISVNKLPT